MLQKINESGYQRARELMEAGENRNLAPMIKAAADQETEWLEVKANPFMPAEGDPFYVRGENADYYEWTNLVKPLIAFANFHGGVLLLGIREDKSDGGKFKPIPLKNRKHEVVDEAGFDGFMNELAECRSKKVWKVVGEKKEAITYELENPLCDLISVEPQKVFYQGQLVHAIFVRVKDEGIAVTESSCNHHSERVPHPDKKGNDIYPTVEKSTRQIYPVRCPGEQGRVEYKDFDAAALRAYRMRNIGASCKDGIRNYYGAISLIDADTLVGRVVECNAVYKILQEGKCPLITGGAGVGKTSLATRLAQKWVGECKQGCVVVKVDAEKLQQLEEAFSCGDFRRLIESQTEEFRWQDRSNAAENCKDVLSWLQSRGIKCLVIYDNIKDVRLLAKSEVSRFCNYEGADSVSFCFVSRRHGALRDTGMVEPYELADLSEEDALELLKGKNPFGDAEEELSAREIIRLPEAAGYRAWVLDIISEQMKSDGMTSYRHRLKQLKRDLSGAIEDASESGGIMTPSLREGKSTVQKLLEPSLAIFDKNPQSLNLLLLSVFLHPDGFGEAEISELYRSVFGVAPEVDDEDWPYVFETMKRPMMDRHVWLNAGIGFTMHRLTAEGIRGKYGKELLGIWKKLSAYLEDCVTGKIDLGRMPTVLSILSAASGMSQFPEFADDVTRLCLYTENHTDSQFLMRAIEFCPENTDLHGLIDSFRSESSVAAKYACAQYDAVRGVTDLRPVVDVLVSIVDAPRPEDVTDALTWHYVALAYLLLGDLFSDRLSKKCAFGCYCDAIEIMYRRMGWDSHPDVLRAVNRLYDVGRGWHVWSDEVSQRVLALYEKLGTSLDLAFRCRTEGDYEYAILSDSQELQLHADLAEMEDEDRSAAVQGFVRARLAIALRWYRKCADVLRKIGVGTTPCFLAECYIADLYDHANCVLGNYGGAGELRKESERMLSEIISKYKLLDADEVKEACKGAIPDCGRTNDCENAKFLRERLLRHVREVRTGRRSGCPDALDRLLDRLSVNSGDVANTYAYVEINYNWLGSPFLFSHTNDESVDIAKISGIAKRHLMLLTRFLKEMDFECPTVCEFLQISDSEFRDVYRAIGTLNEEGEWCFDALTDFCGAKGLMADAVDLLQGRLRLWESRGYDECWRHDMETLGEVYYSVQNYRASLQAYDEIIRKTSRRSDVTRYAYERCRCCELMNDRESVQRILQESQGGANYPLLTDMADLCRKRGLPRYEWYVKRMIELSTSKIEALQASLRAAGGFVVRNAETGEESESGDVVRLYKELKARAELHEKIGAKELCVKDNADAEKLAKEVSERLPDRFVIGMIDGL